MSKLRIELTKQHRGGENSGSFSGRSNGEQVREVLDLNLKDQDDNTYMISIPCDTISFNPSFYLGLFYDSFKKLGGLEHFKEKYVFDLSNLTEDQQKSIGANLSQNERKASNEYKGLTGLDIFM